eukprot:3412621-Rhodomonas_salina.1
MDPSPAPACVHALTPEEVFKLADAREWLTLAQMLHQGSLAAVGNAERVVRETLLILRESAKNLHLREVAVSHAEEEIRLHAGLPARPVPDCASSCPQCGPHSRA